MKHEHYKFTIYDFVLIPIFIENWSFILYYS